MQNAALHSQGLRQGRKSFLLLNKGDLIETQGVAKRNNIMPPICFIPLFQVILHISGLLCGDALLTEVPIGYLSCLFH